MRDRVTVRIPADQDAGLDEVVEDGTFPNRSEAVREAIRLLLHRYRPERPVAVADGGVVGVDRYVSQVRIHTFGITDLPGDERDTEPVYRGWAQVTADTLDEAIPETSVELETLLERDPSAIATDGGRPVDAPGKSRLYRVGLDVDELVDVHDLVDWSSVPGIEAAEADEWRARLQTARDELLEETDE